MGILVLTEIPAVTCSQIGQKIDPADVDRALITVHIDVHGSFQRFVGYVEFHPFQWFFGVGNFAAQRQERLLGNGGQTHGTEDADNEKRGEHESGFFLFHTKPPAERSLQKCRRRADSKPYAGFPCFMSWRSAVIRGIIRD